MATKHITEQSPAALKQSVKSVLGEYPADIIEGERIATSSFAWLEELFSLIEGAATASENAGAALARISVLAGMGKYLAADHEQLFDSRREVMSTALIAAGLDSAAATIEGVNHG